MGQGHTFEIEKLKKAKEILHKMANGLDPVKGGEIPHDSFLQDPRMIRCLFFISDVLDKEIGYKMRGSQVYPAAFSITQTEKEAVVLPSSNIGVNEFARCVNRVLDLNRTKMVSGVLINKGLKTMGILSEAEMTDGKKRTTITEKSSQYGILSETRTYNNNEYEIVVFNEQGKNFLLDNLEDIVAATIDPVASD